MMFRFIFKIKKQKEINCYLKIGFHQICSFQNWSFPRFFGSGLKGACPLATLSNIYVDISSNDTVHTYELIPPPTMETTSYRGGQKNKIAVYDVRSHSKDGMFTIVSVCKKKTMASVSYPSILYANRYIVG